MRAIRITAGGLLALVVLAAALIGGAIWKTLPARDETAAIPGLSAPVDITWDTDGIPRIRAATEADAVAALGWVHARDRMFQMEMMRRAGSGRLSELAGPATLPLDRRNRVLGLRRRAEADLKLLSADARAIADAYARGVNAYVAAHGRFTAPEFLLFGAPEPWTPVDSLLWGKLMAQSLALNWHEEAARLAGHFTPAQVSTYWPTEVVPHADAALLPPSATPALTRLAAATLAAIPAFPAPFTLPEEASNEWAIAGARSHSGKPILAGDPHLGFSFPGIWYLARIELPTGARVGATSPGVPFVILGHNASIAWTFTTTGADTQDLFIETPVGADQYATPDGPKPFETRTETIHVRGQKDVTMTVRETRHGPVISDLAKGDAGPNAGTGTGGQVLALAATELLPGDTTAEGLLGINRAGSAAEAVAAAAKVTSPVQNLLVADGQGEHGHIALAVTGRVPVRRAGDGRVPTDGADGAHDWTGIASGDSLPRFLDPPSGRLVNGNEPVVGPEFPVFMGGDTYPAWRADRIRAMLDAAHAPTAPDFSAMQADTHSEFAARLLPRLRAVPPRSDLARRAVALLADWDGSARRETPQPLIFNVWIAAFHDRLVARGLPDDPAINARPLDEALITGAAPADACGGDCAAILSLALDDAVATIAKRFGDDPAAWRWGPAHRAVFAHPLLGRLPLIGGFFVGRIDSAGDNATVMRGVPGPDWTNLHGASLRAAYDLADLDASRFVVAPGQSGNPFTATAWNFLQRWADGTTITLGPVPDAVAAKARLAP